MNYYTKNKENLDEDVDRNGYDYNAESQDPRLRLELLLSTTRLIDCFLGLIMKVVIITTKKWSHQVVNVIILVITMRSIHTEKDTGG